MWGLGVFVMVSLLIQRTFFVRALLVQSEESPQVLTGLLRQCCTTLQTSRPVTLRKTTLSTSPSVCGLMKPTILLPDHLVEAFDSQDLKSILLHELAHVKRGDLGVNLCQTFLQVIYFYHPLLWIANAQIRRIREQAVDETVLAAMGQEAEAYPKTLITVSKQVWGRPVLSLRLLGVVESKKALSQRINHITSQPFPKTVRISLVSLMGILLIGVLLLPMAQAIQPESNTAPKSAFKATLPNGVTVELVGISHHFMQSDRPEQQAWWRPDGQPLKEMPYAELGWSTTNKNSLEFAFHLTGSDEYTLKSRSPHRFDDQWLNANIPTQADGTTVNGLRAFMGEFDENDQVSDVSLGVAIGEWGKVDEWEVYDWNRDLTNMLFESKAPVVFTPPRDERGGFFVTVTHGYMDDATRLVLVEKNGTAHPSGHSLQSRGKAIQKNAYYFWDVDRADIDKFIFEKRPYQWVHFSNVSLGPGIDTDVSIQIQNNQPILGRFRPGASTEEMMIVSEDDLLPEQTDKGKYRITLPNETKIQLVGLAKVTESGLQTWKPNGDVMPNPGLLESEIDQMGVVAILKTAGDRLSFRAATLKGSKEKLSVFEYASDSDEFDLQPLGCPEDQRYGTLILDDIESGPFKRISIPATRDELFDKEPASQFRNDLKQINVTDIDYTASASQLQLTLHFSQHAKAPNGLYLAEDIHGNSHESSSIPFWKDKCILNFPLPVKELKALIVQQQDTARITFKNISLEPGRISKVKIEQTFTPAAGEIIDLDLP
ncbi:MAG: M56 family metallopeptidase, partial [Phycisphaeraceae bacterium]|nr:M56 family metallopeptidase [Phycisphaeraceae bacterium]